MSTPAAPRSTRRDRGQGRTRSGGAHRGGRATLSEKTISTSQASRKSSPNPAPNIPSKNAPSDAKSGHRVSTKGSVSQSQGQFVSLERRSKSATPYHHSSQTLSRGFPLQNAPTQDRTRRDPGSIDDAVYQKHMAEVFVKVRAISID